MPRFTSRRDFLRQTGVGALMTHLAMSLPSLGWAAAASPIKKKRLVFIFSPTV